MTEEQSLLADSVERFVRTRRGPEQGEAPDLWREIAELGWIGVAAPEEAGGLGGSAVEEAICAAGIGQALMPLAYVECAVMAPVLLDAASAHDDLQAIVSGERIVAVADDEPGRPWGAPPACAATTEPGGLRVRGEKMLVCGLERADQVLVSCRNPVSGATMIVRAPASAAAPRREVMLLDGRKARDVAIDMAVPAQDVLLEGAAADAALAAARDRAALATAAESLGAMRGAIELTREHLLTRRQFGRTLSEFQALRHRFADMRSELDMAESAVMAAAARGAGARLVSLAKARAASAGRVIGEAAVQLHGGLGMSQDYEAGRYYKRLLTLATRHGSREDHLDRVAEAWAA